MTSRPRLRTTSPSQSDADSQGETGYDPSVGSGTTPARRAQHRPGGAV